MALWTGPVAAQNEIPADVQRLLEMAAGAEPYQEAHAVYLLDKKELEVRTDGTTRGTIHRIVKVNTDQGVKTFAQQSIPYVETYETVTVTTARVIQPGGQVVSVLERVEKLPDAGLYGDLYPDKRRVLVSFLPALTVGSILDLEYVQEDLKPPFPTGFWDQYVMQALTDPILLSKYVLTVPQGAQFQWHLHNVDPALHKPLETQGNGTISYTWQMTNVPPVGYEPYFMPPFYDLAAWIMVSSLSRWDEIALWYANLARPQYDEDEALLTVVSNEVGILADRDEKIKRLFYLVQREMSYAATVELGETAYQPRPATAVFRSKRGDCKDQTTLLITMLKLAGVEAFPALVRKRSLGPLVRDLPSPGQFNHTVVCVPRGDSYLWLDPTVGVCPFGYVPSSLQGCWALIVRDNGGELAQIPLARPEDNVRRRTAHLRLHRDRSLTGWVTVEDTGLFAIATRQELLSRPPKEWLPYVARSLMKLLPRATLDPVLFDPPDDIRDLHEPMKITFGFRTEEYALEIGNFLAFLPNVFERLTSLEEFAAPERKLPLYFGQPYMTLNTVEIELPPGYQVSQLSSPFELFLECIGSFSTDYRQEGNKVIFNRCFRLEKTLIPAARYEDVKRYFFELIHTEDGNRGVLIQEVG